MMKKTSVIHKMLGQAAMNPFWTWDNEIRQHMTHRIRLDHEIDGEILQKAYEQTLEVWPLLKDAFLEENDGNLYFEENDAPVKVHHSACIVAPGKGLNADRLLSVTYYGDTVYFSGMHSLFDGGSIQMLINGTICRYFSMYLGVEMEEGILPGARAGDKPENYEFYGFLESVAAIPFEWKEDFKRYTDSYDAPDFIFDKEHHVPLYEIAFPAKEFLEYCKQNGATPSIMLFILFAKSVYEINSDLKSPVAVNNTINIRKMLELDLSIAGVSTSSEIAVTRDEIENMTLAEISKKLRDEMNYQRGRDYLLSRIDDMKKGIPGAVTNSKLSLAYMGSQNYGVFTQYIKHVCTYIDECRNLCMLELNGMFHVFIQFGQATASYAQQMMIQMEKAGIAANLQCSIDALPEEIREYGEKGELV